MINESTTQTLYILIGYVASTLPAPGVCHAPWSEDTWFEYRVG